MAAAVIVLGDELACAGFALAGVAARCPAAGEAASAFADARVRAQLVLLAPSVAAQLGAEVLRQAQAAERPLVLVLPDIRDPQPDRAFARRLRAALGIET